MPNEIFERYGNAEEASVSEKNSRLLPRPNHAGQPKWIAEKGMVNPKTLGKRKNYSYRIEIETRPGTEEWLRKFEIKPSNEPLRYAIPADRLDEFNRRITNIRIIKRR